MFGGGQASGDFGGVEQSGDAEEDGFSGFFTANADGAFEAGFSEGARKPQDAGERANRGLLFAGKFCETVFLFGLGAAVKANGPGHQIPLFRSPVGRNRQSKKKFANGFLRELAIADGGDAVELGGGLHQTAHRRFRKNGFMKDGGGVDAAQDLEDANRDARNLSRAAHAGIGGAGRGAQAGHSSGFQTVGVRQVVAPLVP